ncbi:hypothetical protein BH11PAT1_BH11PAT1_4260 [soil metagenome]
MEKSNELVSILLPVHNAQSTLTSCLESLLSQSYENLEIIAIDDFSRDDSYKILRNFRKIDKRLKIYRNVKHYGLTTTLNRGLKRASGQYISFMDPLGICTKDKIRRQVYYLREHQKTVAIGTQSILLDENLRRIGKSEFPQEHEPIYNRLLHGVSMQFETVLINTYLLPKDLLYFYKHEYPLIYRDLFMKLQKYGDFANLNNYLYMQIQHATHTVSSVRNQFISQCMLFIKARFFHDYRPSVASLLSPLIK